MHSRPYWQTLLSSLLLLLVWSEWAQAYTVAVNAGARSLYLQVGAGQTTGTGAAITGGNNSAINLVSITLPTTAIGTGVAQAMTSNSTVINSPIDGTAYCTLSTHTYIGGYYRGVAGSGASTLSVTSPTVLSNGAGGTIPFSQISWVTAIGSGDTTANTIPSGTFAGGTTQSLRTYAVNQWFESCLTFNYANSVFPMTGIYDGRVTYTLSAP